MNTKMCLVIFYKDTSMKEDEAVFTYNKIPAE